MSGREDEAGTRFSCDDAQRACFEAGIKMATIYHQFTGTPFSERNRVSLERTIEDCIRTQPYVEDAVVKIVTNGGDKSDQYSYTSLTGEMIDAEVVIRLGSARVTAAMKYDDDLDYPLMFISSVETVQNA